MAFLLSRTRRIYTSAPLRTKKMTRSGLRKSLQIAAWSGLEFVSIRCGLISALASSKTLTTSEWPNSAATSRIVRFIRSRDLRSALLWRSRRQQSLCPNIAAVKSGYLSIKSRALISAPARMHSSKRGSHPSAAAICMSCCRSMLDDGGSWDDCFKISSAIPRSCLC